MMKVTLVFDGESAHNDAFMAINAGGFFSALWDIDQECRSRLKHGEDVSDQEKKVLERLRDLCRIVDNIE